METIYTDTAKTMAKTFLDKKIIESYRMVSNANGDPTVAELKTFTGYKINIITRIYENQEYLTGSVYLNEAVNSDNAPPYQSDAFHRDHLLTLQYDIHDNDDLVAVFTKSFESFF